MILTNSELTFSWTPTTVVFGVVVFLVTAVFSFLIWKRSGFTASSGFLECLRLLAVAAVAITLNQPEWRETYQPDQKPTIAVLYDASGSMATEDVGSTDSPPTPPRSRGSVASTLSAPELWAPLAEQFEIVIESLRSRLAS